jgi:pimeloyl-ACP methyl ester carboxylesterase
MDLLPRVTSRRVETGRLRMHCLEVGPPDGVPVVLVHGNLSTARFYERVLSDAPERYRLIAADMRGFGDTEPLPIDATRGLRDWADDTYSLVRALGIEQPVHLVGWSTGGAAVAAYALDRPVGSLTLVDPVSPYGYGGTQLDGTPCFPDFAGTGGGGVSPEFVRRLAAQDRSADSPLSPRNVINSSYWSPSYRETPEREELLVEEVLKSVIGDDGYPGDASPSENWPGFAPGTRGIINALSPRYCSWIEIVDLDPKPPILWTYGDGDIVIADGSPWEMGTLGAAGHVPGWPGPEVYPPQQMVAQTRAVLDRYRGAGGRVQVEAFSGSGHFPPVDAEDRWRTTFFGFLDRIGPPQS